MLTVLDMNDLVQTDLLLVVREVIAHNGILRGYAYQARNLSAGHLAFDSIATLKFSAVDEDVEFLVLTLFQFAFDLLLFTFDFLFLAFELAKLKPKVGFIVRLVIFIVWHKFSFAYAL